MPFEGNAATSGKNRNSKAQSALQRMDVGNGLNNKRLRLLGLPNLSIVLDNTDGAGIATALVEVTTDDSNWVALPLVSAAAGTSAYATWVTAARLARVTIGGGQTPSFILSAAA